MGLPATPAYADPLSLRRPGPGQAGRGSPDRPLDRLLVAVGSVLTPPVALASMATASIADSEPYETGFHTVKRALALPDAVPVPLHPYPAQRHHGRIIRCVITALCRPDRLGRRFGKGYMVVKTRAGRGYSFSSRLWSAARRRDHGYHRRRHSGARLRNPTPAAERTSRTA